jgi:NADH-quinone oxidoreductase subunit J
MTWIQFVFIVTAAVTLGSAVRVVSSGKMLHAALWLVAALFGVAILFAMLEAGFFAVVQVLVYIGAIAILVIFAVMLTRHVMEDTGPQVIHYWWLAAILAAMVFAGLVVLIISAGFKAQLPPIQDSQTMIVALGQALVMPDGYLLPFEVASVMLLAALVGSIYIAYQKR